MPALRLPLLSLAAAAAAASPCTVPRDTDIVVYADVASGGVGPLSNAWTRAFFAWWAAGNPRGVINVAYVTDSTELSGYVAGGGGAGGGCVLADSQALPRLKLYAQPGGDALNQTLALGPGGRDNILDFAASPQGHYMGTCAGWFYAAGTYWWQGAYFAHAWAAHWWPTVEGPISAIAEYPAYAPAALDNGLTAVYYGGPAMGLSNATGARLPAGARVLASYAAAPPGLPAGLPAVVHYEGPFVRALLSSPHPEAAADGSLACAPPLPAGCITPAQQLANWRFLAGAINTLLGTDWAVPTAL